MSESLGVRAESVETNSLLLPGHCPDVDVVLQDQKKAELPPQLRIMLEKQQEIDAAKQDELSTENQALKELLHMCMNMCVHICRHVLHIQHWHEQDMCHVSETKLPLPAASKHVL